MIIKNKRGYLQISFAWVFAIVAGIFILFLAIFAVTKFTKTEQTVSGAKIGKEIGVLLNPLETGFETGKTTSLVIPTETRIYNSCNLNGNFGRQIFQLSQKSFNKWTEKGIDIGFSNKYVFSDDVVEGKKFYVFSKPFEFPFKVADLIYMTSSEKTYCFLDAPERIEEEISNLNQENMLIEECLSNSIKVCFNGGSGFQGNECDINVNQNIRSVEKKGEIVYFEEDALMYAAIFANKEIYECQLERLMQRTKQLASIYEDKASFISEEGCPLEVNLFSLRTATNSFSDSAYLITIKGIVEDLEEKNEFATCRLW